MTRPSLSCSKSRSGGGGGLRRGQRATDGVQSVAPPPPPEPKRRRHGRFVLIGSALFTTLVLAIAITAIGVYVVADRLREPGPLSADKAVVVRGASASAIAGTLMNEQVIDSGLMFWLGVRLLGVDQHLHQGEFLFPAHASVETVIDKLVEGKTIDRFVAIPEGKSSEEILAMLKARDDLTGDIKEVPREGTLMPDSYKITRGDSRVRLLARMTEAQRAALADIWKRRSSDLPIHSPQELVVLASIVEKETGKADERPRVAGVFINRLARNMRLQSDPTIVYGLTGGKGPLGHALTKDEMTRPNPYNTYLVDGLPPGPITNPGRAAMEAVANPSRTKDLYFVADGTGGHVFAETLEQHLRNVARWRQIEAERAAAAAGAQPKPPGADTGAPPAPAQPAGPAVPSTTPLNPGTAAAPEAASPPPQAPGRPQRRGQKRGDIQPAIPVGKAPPAMAGAVAEKPRGAPLGSMPLSPAMRARLAREAAAAGIVASPSSGRDPAQALDVFAGPSPPPAAAGLASASLAGKRPLAFDAVEGTPLDPLNYKNFDLNSPKTVPNLK